jgi:hypothetical protein
LGSEAAIAQAAEGKKKKKQKKKTKKKKYGEKVRRVCEQRKTRGKGDDSPSRVYSLFTPLSSSSERSIAVKSGGATWQESLASNMIIVYSAYATVHGLEHEWVGMHTTKR